MLNILVEALVVGIFSIIMGLIVHVVFGYHSKHANSPHMKDEMVNLVITLFFTGFFLHLFFEVVGLNRYYMKIHKNDV
jgi:chromate transport protein ChrA